MLTLRKTFTFLNINVFCILALTNVLVFLKIEEAYDICTLGWAA